MGSGTDDLAESRPTEISRTAEEAVPDLDGVKPGIGKMSDFEQVSRMTDKELENFFCSVDPVTKILWMTLKIVAKDQADAVEFIRRQNGDFTVTVRQGLDRYEMMPPPRQLAEDMMALLAQMMVVQHGFASKHLQGSIKFTLGSQGRLCDIWFGGSMVSKKEKQAFQSHIQLLLAAVIHRQQREEKVLDRTLTSLQHRVSFWRWVAGILGVTIVAKIAGYFLDWWPW